MSGFPVAGMAACAMIIRPRPPLRPIAPHVLTVPIRPVLRPSMLWPLILRTALPRGKRDGGETVHLLPIYRLSEMPLDRAEEIGVLYRYKCQRVAVSCGAAGSPDTVRICLGGVRDIEVDDMRNFRNIDT